MSNNAYWLKRQNSIYIFTIKQIVRVLGEHAKSIVDIGSNGCPYLDWFDWIPERCSLDLRKPYEAKGVTSITADFLKHNFEKKFDVLTCLQVVEHVPDAGAFCKKLLTTANVLIVSVPYQWKAGQTKGHIHDPINLEKMNGWFGREPNYHIIIQEVESSARRLVCVYDPRSTLKWRSVKGFEAAALADAAA